MKTARKFLVLALVFFTFAAGTASAGQQHVVSPADVTAAMSAQVAAQDSDRAVVREALARPEVQGVAASMGVDVSRLAAAVDTLKGADLQQAASTARQVNQQLVGGASTVVISTTTIVIVLLVVILLIVIAK